MVRTMPNMWNTYRCNPTETRCGDHLQAGASDPGSKAISAQGLTESETSGYWELCYAGYKNYKKIKKLKDKIDGLENDVKEIYEEMHDENIDWDRMGKLEDQLFVIDNKIKKSKRHLKKAEIKSRDIRNILSEQRCVILQ